MDYPVSELNSQLNVIEITIEKDPWSMSDFEVNNFEKNVTGFDQKPIMCCCKHGVPHSED